MPRWAMEAAEPAPVRLFDLILEVCRAFPAYTVDAVLDAPVRWFWMMLDNIREHRKERAEVAKVNPFAAMALDGGH